MRAYCRQAGIEESAFYWWRRELARGSRQGEIFANHDAVHPGHPGRPATGKSPRIAAGFLPVQVTADHRPEGGRGGELLLADGRVLRIQLGFDRQTLLDVLGVLEVEDAEPAGVGADLLLYQPTEMRKGFDSLAALVRDWLGHDPLSGHLFVFAAAAAIA